MRHTVANISTALGQGAIAIIRISGQEAIEKIDKIFTGNLVKALPNTIQYGFIKDGNKKLDEVMISVFKAPKSFTGEDMLEINCHGGSYITGLIFKLVLNQGIKPAERGEFTKRAFLNGRIDILKAEAINDIINADSAESLKLANNQLFGKTSQMIKEFYERILMLYTKINVSIDYPEYDDDYLVTNEIALPEINKLIEETEAIIQNAHKGILIKNGLKVLILGKPNVGKSSLLNAIIAEDKAIVTDIPGTTRDVVEGMFYLAGLKIRLLDSAGVHQTNDPVEKIGIEKTKKLIADADLILTVFDNSKVLTKEDEEILKLTETKKRIIVLNKKDLNAKPKLKGENIILLSAVKESNLADLENKMKSALDLKINDDLCYLSNVFHISRLEKVLEALEQAKELINKNNSLELVAFSLNSALDVLKEITGENYNLDFLDKMFANFCLGK
ncbi:MAG: tRNA uridine-5-carboxymethylaminomethyl(34) synthesis GTPase MnmE [Erysipelotrichales bacterium]|nr:tRNA uridine-5-carboxymethylaminomethyl(34) synthesis GTPase MnmE [Erysipelotrichales bacterium]